MKVVKKVLKVILIILGIIIVICLCILPFDLQSHKVIKDKIIEDVDLSEIEDGKYFGKFNHQLRIYEVEVTINNHRITNIKPINNSTVNDYTDRTIKKVIEEQRVTVDTISGATLTSKIVLIAIEDALNKED